MTAIERIKKLSEEWFLTEPLLFVVYCSHELCENSEISVPMRTGNRKIEISPQILEKASDVIPNTAKTPLPTAAPFCAKGFACHGEQCYYCRCL